MDEKEGFVALWKRGCEGCLMMAEEQNHHPDIYLSWGKVRVDV